MYQKNSCSSNKHFNYNQTTCNCFICSLRTRRSKPFSDCINLVEVHVLGFFFLFPLVIALHCLFFCDLRILITPLVSSNSSLACKISSVDSYDFSTLCTALPYKHIKDRLPCLIKWPLRKSG